MDQIQQNFPDFLEIYTQGLLEEAGIEIGEEEKYKQLVEALRKRINARVYLELISMLNPDQVAQVASDIKSDNPDPEKTLNQISQKLGDFPTRVAQILARVRSELLEDLKVLAS